MPDSGNSWQQLLVVLAQYKVPFRNRSRYEVVWVNTSASGLILTEVANLASTTDFAARSKRAGARLSDLGLKPILAI
jgi:hypothetical protein